MKKFLVMLVGSFLTFGAYAIEITAGQALIAYDSATPAEASLYFIGEVSMNMYERMTVEPQNVAISCTGDDNYQPVVMKAGKNYICFTKLPEGCPSANVDYFCLSITNPTDGSLYSLSKKNLNKISIDF